MDSRDEYCGHASILHGVTLPANEPTSAELSEIITERCREIIKYTTYFQDKEPACSAWTGPAF